MTMKRTDCLKVLAENRTDENCVDGMAKHRHLGSALSEQVQFSLVRTMGECSTFAWAFPWLVLTSAFWSLRETALVHEPEFINYDRDAAPPTSTVHLHNKVYENHGGTRRSQWDHLDLVMIARGRHF